VIILVNTYTAFYIFYSIHEKIFYILQLIDR